MSKHSFIDEVFSMDLQIQQLKSELDEFFTFLEPFPIKTYLEIGSLEGGTLALFSHFLPTNSNLIGVDINPTMKNTYWSKVPVKSQFMQVVTGDSLSPAIFNKVKFILQNNEVDLLFIDGNHFQAGKDFEMWKHLVKKNGLVAFHDINKLGPRGNVGTVPFFWEKIREEYEHWEFNAEDPRGYGIGVIRYV